ncbi:MarR family transcriptional regulator [Desulfonema ishimotonii]|uniref:MarR family transcriptional regulator n=1 Tax=Desulfonema ishimotonii TaxID=45657 RepID=A0A401FQC2_9BACT|nr:MarR family transcriptional regulator [Desulfonema ishimotonii]GBC59188.1 MarR family transcriptional regulator [Desulfonema ishimotonii]
MNLKNESVIKEIVGAIRQLYRGVYLDSCKMSRRFGLTGPQGNVLRTLIQHGPLSSAELSRKLFVTPSNMTGIIDRLENKGLIERVRKQGDRRVILIRLTEKGMQLGNNVPDSIEKKLISGLADLEHEEVGNLLKAINQILCLVDAEDLPDAPIDVNLSSNSVP